MVAEELVDAERKEKIDEFVKQFSSFLGNRKATYVAGPITNGKRFMDWYQAKGQMLLNDKLQYSSLHYNDVVAPNLNIITKFANELRGNSHEPIIDPASFEHPFWTQNEYIYYWCSIITRYVKRIVFMDGWQYSKGCCFEYILGLTINLDLNTQSFQ